MIKIGTPLTLEIEKNKIIERYRCKVVEHEGHTLYVDYPINETTGRTNIFPNGTEFSASYVGNDNSVYRFTTEILGRKNINIPTLMLHYPQTNLIRVQRREYVRIEANVDIAVHEPSDQFIPFTTVTHDISGGGASIIIPKNHNIKPGMTLDIWLVLPMESGENEYVYASSKAIRIKERSSEAKPLLSIQFIDIKDKDRQLIIKYCFEKQLRARRGLF